MKNLLFVSAIFIGLIANSFAQNQVSQTSFYENNSQLDAVQAILKTGGIEGTSALFLMDENNPMGEKAVVINSLLSSEKSNNAETFTMFLARKYGVNFQELDINSLTANEVFCLGYITLVNDDGNPNKALPILEKAIEKMPNSTTVQMIGAIAKAQAEINNNNNCEAWKAFSKVIANTGLNNDLEENSKSAFIDAMSSYEGSCN